MDKEKTEIAILTTVSVISLTALWFVRARLRLFFSIGGAGGVSHPTMPHICRPYRFHRLGIHH
jgi:hypothetical protein